MILDDNIILVPISMLMMNLTGPLLQKRMPRPIFEFLELPIFAPFMYMFLFYVAVRKFFVALILGILMYIITITFLNDKSVFYILPRRKEDDTQIKIPDLKGELAVGKPALARRNAMVNHYKKKEENITQYRRIMDTINGKQSDAETQLNYTVNSGIFTSSNGGGAF